MMKSEGGHANKSATEDGDAKSKKAAGEIGELIEARETLERLIRLIEFLNTGNIGDTHLDDGSLLVAAEDGDSKSKKAVSDYEKLEQEKEELSRLKILIVVITSALESRNEPVKNKKITKSEDVLLAAARKALDTEKQDGPAVYPDNKLSARLRQSVEENENQNPDGSLLVATRKALNAEQQKKLEAAIRLKNMLEKSVVAHEAILREKEKREQIRREFIAIARELAEIQAGITFSGIDSDGYSKIKATDDEFPGYAMPIDELIVRFENEGMKVVFGTDPMGSNVLIMPFEMADDDYNGIQPEHLKLDVNMDERLKKLILLRRSYPRQG